MRDDYHRPMTRRELIFRAGAGFGGLALTGLLSDDGLLAVRCAVLADIARLEIRGDDLEVAVALGAAAAGKFPSRARLSLPTGL